MCLCNMPRGSPSEHGDSELAGVSGVSGGEGSYLFSERSLQLHNQENGLEAAGKKADS